MIDRPQPGRRAARLRFATRLHGPLCGWLVSRLLLTAALGSAPAWGQNVSLAGSMGNDKALLMIDGRPRMLALGASSQGVTLRRLADGQAVVEVAGRSITLTLGAAPARLDGAGGGGGAPAGDSEIVLPMGPGGHFSGAGAINGKPVQFLVDTGATSIALSQGEANRIGLDWKRGKPALSATANGPVPVYVINLTSVRLGPVEVANVEAVVLPSDMPMVLLGNSFLVRFTMRSDSEAMRLAKKP